MSRALWRTPLLLGLITASGLASALVADGWGNVWSWFALAAPLALALGGVKKKN